MNLKPTLLAVSFALLTGCFADSSPKSDNPPPPPPPGPGPISNADLLDEVQSTLSDALSGLAGIAPGQAQIFLCSDQAINQLVDGPDRLLTDTTNGAPQDGIGDFQAGVMSLANTLPQLLASLSGMETSCAKYEKPADGSAPPPSGNTDLAAILDAIASGSSAITSNFSDGGAALSALTSTLQGIPSGGTLDPAVVQSQLEALAAAAQNEQVAGALNALATQLDPNTFGLESITSSLQSVVAGIPGG